MNEDKEVCERLLLLHLIENCSCQKWQLERKDGFNVGVNKSKLEFTWAAQNNKHKIKSVSVFRCLQLQWCDWPVDEAGDLHHGAAHSSGPGLRETKEGNQMSCHGLGYSLLLNLRASRLATVGLICNRIWCPSLTFQVEWLLLSSAFQTACLCLLWLTIYLKT